MMTVTHPSVSVVIPTRRGGPLLRRAVESVLSQDYVGEVEAVVVFDGSEADSQGIDTLAGPFRHLQVCQNERVRGPSGARNTGILRAKGEVIGFLDDDDRWIPSKLRLQIDAMRRHDAQVCVSGVRYVADGRFKDYIPGLSDDVLRDIVGRSVFIPLQGMLVESAALEETGFLDEELWVTEDTDLMLRLASRFGFSSIPAPLVVMERAHADRLSLDFVRYRDAYTRLMGKHRDLFARFPGGHAKRCWRLAGLALLTGRRTDARRWAWQAIRNDPRSPKNWAMVGCAELLPAVLLPPCFAFYQRFGWSKLPPPAEAGNGSTADDGVMTSWTGD